MSEQWLWSAGRLGAGLTALVVLIAIETRAPARSGYRERLRHGGVNGALAMINNLMIVLALALLASAGVGFETAPRFGALAWFSAPWWIEALVALALFDVWMYLWHRANHQIPFLWRFHRVHHTDPAMDATTALRFHPGEILLSTALRLMVVPFVIGMRVWHLALYEALLMPVIMFHHSNVAISERWDRRLRWLIVTPRMHWMHHSDRPEETDSNFASLLSWPDRLARTFNLRRDPRRVRFGLREYPRAWHGLAHSLITPFAPVPSAAHRRASQACDD